MMNARPHVLLVVVSLAAGCGGAVEGEAANDSGASPPSLPAPACTSTPGDPVKLADWSQSDVVLARGLAVTSDAVFVGLTFGKTGAIKRFSLAGGAVATFAAGDYLDGPIRADAGHVYYFRSVLTSLGGELSAPTPINVVIYDTSTGATDVLPNPHASEPHNQLVELALGPAGDLVWSSHSLTGTSIDRWDAASRTVQTIAAPGGATSLNVDAENAYWVSAGGSARFLRSLPLRGGDPTDVISSSSQIDLFGVDATSFFLGVQADQRTTNLQVIEKRTLAVRRSASMPTIVSIPYAGSTPIFDEEYFYWYDYADSQTLQRTGRYGTKPPISFAKTTDPWLAALAGDACRVYFTTESGLWAATK